MTAPSGARSVTKELKYSRHDGSADLASHRCLTNSGSSCLTTSVSTHVANLLSAHSFVVNGSPERWNPAAKSFFSSAAVTTGGSCLKSPTTTSLTFLPAARSAFFSTLIANENASALAMEISSITTQDALESTLTAWSCFAPTLSLRHGTGIPNSECIVEPPAFTAATPVGAQTTAPSTELTNSLTRVVFPVPAGPVRNTSLVLSNSTFLASLRPLATFIKHFLSAWPGAQTRGSPRSTSQAPRARTTRTFRFRCFFRRPGAGPSCRSRRTPPRRP